MCSTAQLTARLLRHRGATLEHPELAPVVAEHRAAGRRIVFTNGCFDVLHRGHVAYLAQAKQLGDVLVVALNSDESVARLKGPDRRVLRWAGREVTLLRNLPRRGLAQQRSFLLSRATAPRVLFLDDDVWLEPHHGSGPEGGRGAPPRPRSRHHVNLRLDGVRTMAVLRANAVGDYVMSLPALQALRAG